MNRVTKPLKAKSTAVSTAPVHVRLCELDSLDIRMHGKKRYALVDGVLRPVKVVFGPQ